MADRLGAAQEEAGVDVANRSIGVQLAYGRRASDVKLRRAVVERHGLAAFCRVVFNSNEFVYVD